MTMKKIAKIQSIALWAFMPLLLLVTSCTNTDEGVGISSSGHDMTLSVIMPDEGTTRVGIEPYGDSKNFITQWDDADEVQVFITQGNQCYSIGKVGVKNISEDKKNASITFELPESLDFSKSYSIHALSGIEGKMVQNGATWYPQCAAELYRNVLTYFNAPLYCKMDVDDDLNPTLQFKHIGTYEILHFTNATDKTIKFEHRGFDVEKPWYYKKAVGYLLPKGGVALDTDATIYGDIESEFYYVAAGQTTMLVSWYIPTQNKMSGAELKATIDGAPLKSANKKSSDIEIEIGHAYHMYATWNGSELTFDNGDVPEVPTQKIISIDPNRLEFDMLAVDQGASKTFKVSNTGTAALTYKIAATSGDFSIAGSGKEVTLQPNSSDEYMVVFKPTIEDHQYSQTVEITSDASNGTQYLTLTGSSEKKRIDHVIPPEYKDELDPYITIYEGANPPNIEGIYLMSPDELKYDATFQFEIGHVFSDMYLHFYNQDMINNTIDYQEKQSKSEGTGEGCFISGEDNKFTVYFNVDEVTHYSKYEIYVKKAVIISGILTDDGIKDLEYGFIFVEKSDDPDKYLINPGDFRIIKDGDGMGSKTTWPSSIRTKSYAPKLQSAGETAK